MVYVEQQDGRYNPGKPSIAAAMWVCLATGHTDTRRGFRSLALWFSRI
jgi:hypothetical protein